MPIEAVTRTSPWSTYELFGNDDLNVAAGVVLTSTGNDAILAYDAAGLHRITVAGTIIAYDDCINLLGSEGAQYVEIAETGLLMSGVGSDIETADGVLMYGVGSAMVNNGTIIAQGSAVQLVVSDGGTTTVTNNGVMTTESYGIWNRFGSGTLEFTNTGTVESAVQSYLGGGFVDHVTNSGTMIGNVELGGGDDLYVGTGGSVAGAILGGSGDDRFVVGLSNEAIDGGEGIDTLDLSGLHQKMTVNLTAPSQNKGAGVAGDSYAGIENIIGTVCRDVLTGDGADNRLHGGGSHDMLAGAGGNDTLAGGHGADTLTGGAGADVFVFETYADRGDVLTDFTTGADVMLIDAAAYGFGSAAIGALSAGAFLTTADSNTAQDATDRLIFRASDATLWFDRDGTGDLGPVLLADLADGTTITTTDIFLI